MNYFNFLLKKIQCYSFKNIIFLEIESLLFGIFSMFPTTIGVLARAILLKLFAAKCKGIAWLQPKVTIVHADRIQIGSNFGVNSGSYINGVGYIEIGDFVLIGNNVTISSGMHPIEGRETPIFARPTVPKRIIIEDDVWIGAGAVIMPGVRLSKGTVVGANSVVTRDTEPFSVVVGAPAKFLRRR